MNALTACVESGSVRSRSLSSVLSMRVPADMVQGSVEEMGFFNDASNDMCLEAYGVDERGKTGRAACLPARGD